MTENKYTPKKTKAKSLRPTSQSYIEVPFAKTPKQAEKIEAQSDDSNKMDSPPG